jgi:hypothetical protein
MQLSKSALFSSVLRSSVQSTSFSDRMKTVHPVLGLAGMGRTAVACCQVVAQSLK